MPLDWQFWHYNVLVDVDLIFCENETDVPYFRGFVPGKPVMNLKDLIVEDQIKDVHNVVQQNKAIIGGNFCRWYGGFDSYIVAQEFNCPLWAPSMGRKIEGEEQVPDLEHLPFMPWGQWMYKLAEFKYAIHLMQTFAAGSFMLNCAYLGIPCIGYNRVDTQRNLFPDLSIEIDDLDSARKLANKLVNDKDFYTHCSSTAKSLYQKHYSEKAFSNWKNEFFPNIDNFIKDWK